MTKVPNAGQVDNSYIAEQNDDGCCSGCFKSIKALFSDEPQKGYSKY